MPVAFFRPTLMKTPSIIFSQLCMCVLLATGGLAQALNEPADDLMSTVRKNMPMDEVDVTARLRTRNRQGDVRNVQELDFILRLGQQPAEARYVLRSRFGDFKQGIRIQLDEDSGIPRVEQQTEEDGAFVAVTNQYASIEDTEINWLDVSFGFLWWPGGEIVGRDTKLGRNCLVVDLPSPDPIAPYAGVRLWIDPEIHAVLEIEAYGQEDNRLKRLRVKSLRKREDKWFLKELEVLNVENYRRTHIILSF